VPRGHCPPPAASADRMLFPLCGAIKQQASKQELVRRASLMFEVAVALGLVRDPVQSGH
jgi:hypothetical protein